MALLRLDFRKVSTSSRLIAGKTFCSKNYVSIPEFYDGKSVLVTGCTGFLGQGLVEKLLRNCPGIRNIYVSIKPNTRGDTEQRYQQFIQYKVFDELRKKEPDFARKIIPFNGDLIQDNMGLSGNQLTRMTEDVSVIVHCAALIKLNPSLRESIEANVLAARNTFRFGQKCRKLCAYINVSTVFSNMHLDHIKEEVYPMNSNKSTDAMISLLRSHSDAELRKNEKQVIEPSPMVYLYTKKVAECIVTEVQHSVPTAVFRCPFISPALSEPFPAWTYGHGGYCGILHNVKMGTLRHLAGIPDTPIEMLPVDMIVNSLISTGWYLGTGRHKDTGPLVVHVHSSTDNPVTIRDLGDAIQDECIAVTGQKDSIRFKIVSNRLEHRFWYITCYILPALYRDALVIFRGGKATNLATQLRLRKGLKYLEMSTFHNPTKDFNNAKLIHSLLMDQDKKDFPFDVQSIKWNDYLRNWMKMKRGDEKI